MQIKFGPVITGPDNGTHVVQANPGECQVFPAGACPGSPGSASLRVEREPLASRHPCHVTFKVKKDVHPLRSAKLVNELERSWREACDRGRFRLVEYSIQSDHVHLIVEATSARDLACGLKSIAARFARAVNRVWRRAGAVLVDRCHVHVLLAPPRTWLLSMGWRRRGLIDPAEIPGR